MRMPKRNERVLNLPGCCELKWQQHSGEFSLNEAWMKQLGFQSEGSRKLGLVIVTTKIEIERRRRVCEFVWVSVSYTHTWDCIKGFMKNED